MRRLLPLLAAAFAVLGAVLVVRASAFGSRQIAVDPPPALAVDAHAAAERLAGALRIPTISPGPGSPLDSAAFERMHEYLAATFPAAHAAMAVERVEGYSLLFTWPGADPSLPPILLMAHLDVVPVEPAAEPEWTHPPFAGHIADGFVWGRGAIDDKSGVLGLLEAAEMLAAEGFVPRRTVFLAFGHDEETGGRGARATARLLEERGIRLELVLDEGGGVMHELMPGLERPVALVGTAEKGFVSLELSVRHEGGHSSMPPPETAAGIVSRAIARLQDRPFPASLSGPTREMLLYLGPEMPFVQRLVIANTWLFGPLLERQFGGSSSTNALVRTTTAPTMLEGSPRDNVLPTHARGVVNFRILPGETIESVTDRVRRLVADERVELREYDGFGSDPSAVSPSSGPAFETVHRTIREIFPDAVVSPYLVVGATDARHYTVVSENVYRFLPVRMTEEDLPRIHERISIDGHADAIRFYRRLIVNAAG